MENEMKILPVVALRGMTIMPGMVVHFDISRKRSVAAVQEAMVRDQKIFMVTQRKVETENPGQDELFEFGTVGTIKQLIKLPKNIIRVLVSSEDRGQLKELRNKDPFLQADVEIIKDEDIEIEDEANKIAMVRGMKEILTDYVNESGKVVDETVQQLVEIDDVFELVRQIPVHIGFNYLDLQDILNETDFWSRYETIAYKLVNELKINEIKQNVQKKVKRRLENHQREYILREQLKVIREELGEDKSDSETGEYEKKLEKLDAPDAIKKRIRKEMNRLQKMNPFSSESEVSRSYLDTMLDIPWSKKAELNTDIEHAEKILNEDHYGLKNVKERVLEFLAVLQLTKHGQSPILCLVGPPGTGKTSIAKSLGRAMDRPCVRISLGGVRDEAEIRGHRKTYVGAMPGRIVNGMIRAGVKNPVMVLDEIDKVSTDYNRGDTFSALLEVLDSEQNFEFRDHFVEEPLDLSEVMFVTTANTLDTIPRPLLDRMEVIEIGSYTENEKIHIAQEHLIPKQIEKNGLTKEQLQFSKAAISKMISAYTMEAGVRQLEREIGKVCRKTAKIIFTSDKKSVSVTERNIQKFSGREKYTVEMANKTDEIGIVRGLAWTSVGGVTIPIEVNVMPGSGEVLLTGQLGDVMKESAQAGISYIRSISSRYDIADNYFEKHDIHVHILEGATPKDGPSAGTAMATAILSAVIGRKVRKDVAMTGEISLRGRVLKIGGLKEKLLAAKIAGIKTALVPADNEADVEELSDEIVKGLEIIYVTTMEEVIDHAFISG